MRNLIIVTLLALVACSDPNVNSLDGIAYERSIDTCEATDAKHWLVDLLIKTESDSLILDSRNMKRKVELDERHMDTNSAVYKLITGTCIDASISMEVTAGRFYIALGGVVPEGIDSNQQMKVTAWVRDALNPIDYLAHKLAFEQEALARYTERNGWNAIHDTMTGIYYEAVLDKDGEANRPKGKVNYLMMTLNHDLIVQNRQGEPLIYDIEDKAILPGIRYVVSKMSEGDRFRALLPSSQAFGAMGNERVPGYTPIVVELELYDTME